MVWIEAKGRDYLGRSYNGKSGIRRRAAIGIRTTDTEKKADYDHRRRSSTGRHGHAGGAAVTDRREMTPRGVHREGGCLPPYLC